MTLLFTLISLMALHGLFVAAEYAIVKTASFDKSVAQATAKSTPTLIILKNLEDYLTVCQLAKTIVLMSMGLALGLLLSSVSVGVAGKLPDLSWEQMGWFVLGFFGIVVMQLVLGFELPRRIGVNRADRCTEALGRQLILCRWVLWPILTILNRFKQLLAHVACKQANTTI